MKTLVVPDIHEQVEKLEKLSNFFEKWDTVVFLGDWFDTYGPRKHTSTARFLKERLDDKRYVFLLGNHDGHYAFQHAGFLCSGFQWQTKEDLRTILGPEDWKRFRLFYQAGPFLLSHAGLRPETKHFIDEEMEALEMAASGKFHRAFAAGWSRGGYEEFGGPTWLDWEKEFMPLVKRPQIVGHSQMNRVRTRMNTNAEGFSSYCIDDALKSLVVVHSSGVLDWYKVANIIGDEIDKPLTGSVV